MYTQIDQNKSNTRILMYIFIFFFMLVGYGFGFVYTANGEEAIGLMGIFGFVAIVYALISYYTAGSIALGITGAKEIERKDNPTLYRTVENLAIAGGVPTPKIYLIDDTALNAFATGRDPTHASVAITSGLLEKLDKPELEGVMAHELSHIRNFDIRLQSVTVALIGLIALISDIFLRNLYYGGRRRTRGKAGGILILVGIALAILSPIIAKIMHLAVSRQREYLADASGSLLTRFPEGLARALEKIKADKEPLEAANKATAHMYIENPLRNEKGMKWINSLFATHPDINDRIDRLRGMAL
jgi:heat shock protein HtpX